MDIDKVKTETRTLRAYLADMYRDVLDKAGNSYMAHLNYVADVSYSFGVSMGLNDEELRIVYVLGLIHDTLEDLPAGMDAEALIQEITYRIPSDYFPTMYTEFSDAWLRITRSKGMTYSQYLERVKGNKYSCIVKTADASDNSRLERFKICDRTEENKRHCQTYAKRSIMLLKHFKSTYNKE